MKKRQTFCNLYVEYFGKSSAKLNTKVQIYTSERRGRLCYTQHVPIGHIGTICFNSFRWKASRLFNSLPANIRNTTNCETSVFKKKVDSYLQAIQPILDNPCVPNEDNSLDARINEMRWCTLRGGLDGSEDQLKYPEVDLQVVIYMPVIMPFHKPDHAYAVNRTCLGYMDAESLYGNMCVVQCLL